jgi:uncharacterized small protein (DUF1192 family)
MASASLVLPLQRAIESAASGLGDDELSSTDTAVSSPIFDTCSAKGSSDGSITEEEKEEPVNESKPSPPAMEETQAKDDEVQAVVPTRSLATKKSFWNLIRGASMSVAAPAAPDSVSASEIVPVEVIKPGERVEAQPFQQPQILEPITSALNKRRSFATFPSLNWSKSSRRHTLTATVSGEASQSMSLGAERSLDGSIHLPKRNVDEVKVAEDAMRFADARHVIKTEQDIDVIRVLAERLEQGWREKQHELAVMRSKMEESQLHLHDIRDENKHLRSQLATMSEQIVARDVDFEELQKMAVEQSRKERDIWEVEKHQAVQEVEERVKELQEELAKWKSHHRRSHSLIDESDEESDYRDAVLFSATTSASTSIDDEMQYQQSSLAVPFTTPTTPTTHTHGASAWYNRYNALQVDPLSERLAALQGRQAVI